MGMLKRGPRRALAALLIGAMFAPMIVWNEASASTPVPSFDWSMPDRFGLDRNADGLIDYVDGAADATTGYDATPDSWHVDLNACASNAGSGATYHWTVVDQPNPATPITVQGGPTCDSFFMVVPEEGTYRVDLSVEANGVTSATLRRDVVVQDWLIVSVGDSYGSGEGAPDIPIDQHDLYEADKAWQDVGAALEEITVVRTSMQPIIDEIAKWQDAIDRVALYCNPAGDAGMCAQAGLDVVAESALVVFQLAAYGVHVTGEFIGDAVTAVGDLVNAAVQTWEAAVQLAKSITGNVRATWEARRCHRSANSGSAQAAKALEDADPHTSVTFVHLACSGASMVYGLLGYYQGTEHPDTINNEVCNPSDPANRPAECIRPQLEVAKELVGNREVDATYVSIGGNDAHFADIVIACIVQSNCGAPNPISDPLQLISVFCNPIVPSEYGNLLKADCEDWVHGLPSLMDTAAELLEEGVHGDVRNPIDPGYPGLANGYNLVADGLVGAGKLLPDGRASRVFVSQYVDAVKRDDGTLCDFGTMGLSSIPGLSNIESGFIDTTVIPTLFGEIQQATADHGWTYVDGIYDGFTNHGYCAQNHFIVRAQETFLNEGVYQGMVHPNRFGYQVYANAILPKWVTQMYPNGMSAEPRRPDQAPFADAGAAATVVEGSSTTLSGSAWDSNGDAVTYAWTHDRPGKATITPTTAASPTLAGIDDTTGTATLTVSDAGGSRSDTVGFTVTNAAPVIGTTSSLDAPVAVGTAVTGRVPFTDVGTLDTHNASFAWGDGSTSAATITESNGAGTATASHSYATAGLYPVTITVTDDDGGSASVAHEYVVVYDPAGGFVTGGGWFQSPSGAYTPADSSDPDVVGSARFAFVSKYVKGATAPSGTTSFRFSAGNLDFDSTSYDWLVVSGTKASYRGLGTVNGVAGYRFLLVANDGDSKPGGNDQLRVRIWNDATGVVLYDNQATAALDAAPVTTVGGGQITVQK